MKKYTLFLFLLFPIVSFAQTSAGIPSNGIWFSKEPFFAGEDITISTVVFNATASDINGTLELLDKDSLVEKKDVKLSAGENKVINFSLKVSEGKHSFSVRVAGGDFVSDSGSPIALKISKSNNDYVIQTPQVSREALKDTDSDGIADINDKDIDGDSLTNDEEKKLGTNSKIADTDGDGILDGVDKNPLKYDSLPSTASAITSEDAQNVAKKVEKIIPSSIVQPVVSVATPVIGKIESFRVGEANNNNERIVGTIDDIIDKVGTAKVLDLASKSTTTASTTVKTATGKPTGWEVFKSGVTGDSFVKTPFGYIKLLGLIIYQFILSNTWIFYIILLAIVFKIIVTIKRFIFNRGE